jgi:hypothetical protein
MIVAHKRHHRRPKDRTAAQRMRDLRAREETHERCPIVKGIGPPITDTMIAVGLLTEAELENNERLGQACKAALLMWSEDRAKWLERHFVTRNTAGRKDGL